MLGIILIIAYLSVISIIGMRQQKKHSTFQEYGAASQTIGMPAVATLTATGIASAGATTGIVENSFRFGISSTLITVTAGIACIFLLPMIEKMIRVFAVKKKAVTAVEIVKYRFGQKTGLSLAILGIISGILMASSAIVAATSIIASMLKSNMAIAVLVYMVFVLSLVMRGGLKGTANSSIVHGIVLLTAVSVVAIAALMKVHSESLSLSMLPANYFRLNQPTPLISGSFVLSMLFALSVSSQALGGTIGAKSDRAAKRGVIIAGIILIIVAIMTCIIGLSGKVLMNNTPASSSLIFDIAVFINPVWGYVISIAVLAAIISSAVPSYLFLGNILATMLYKPIAVKRYENDVLDKKLLLVSKSVSVICMVIAVIIAFLYSSIFGLILLAVTMCAPFAMITVLGRFFKSIDDATAFTAGSIGACTTMVWMLLGNPYGIPAIYISLTSTMILLVLVTAIRRPGIAPGYALYLELAEEYDQDLREAARDADRRKQDKRKIS